MCLMFINIGRFASVIRSEGLDTVKYRATSAVRSPKVQNKIAFYIKQ